MTERIVAAVEGREVDRRRGDYLGKVVCFFEIGDGKGTLLQFDHEHPPKPKPAEAPRQDRVQQDVPAHRAQGPRLKADRVPPSR